MPRPKSKIDLVELEKLCAMQCTDDEIAAFFGVSTRTVERRRKAQRFSEVMEQARSKGRVSVRRNLFRLAAGPPSSWPRISSAIETLSRTSTADRMADRFRLIPGRISQLCRTRN
jgi:hypothetical protein